MRGIAKNPVTCTKCGSPDGYPNTGLCRRCTPQRKANLYTWTPEMDDYLCRIYADNAINKRDLGRALRTFSQQYRLPRHQPAHRAQRLGLTVDVRHKWTAEDFNTLRELQGKPVKNIARKLGRGVDSVKAMMDKMKISRQITEGYTREDVMMLLGASRKTVQQWIGIGLIKVHRQTGRVTEESVEKFIHNHPEKYSLKRVDEAWFKGLMFSTFGLREANMNVGRGSSAPLEMAI